MVLAFAPLRGILVSPKMTNNDETRRLKGSHTIGMSSDASNSVNSNMLDRTMECFRFLVNETSDKEFYIISSIFAIAVVRLSLDRQRRKKESVGVEDNKQSVQNGPFIENFPAVVTSLAAVSASLIVPFLDLDAAVLLAEITPVTEVELIAEIPNLQKVEFIDSAYDVEGVIDQLKPNSQKRSENDNEIEVLDKKDNVVPNKMLMVTGGLLGTAITKSKRPPTNNKI